jgi:hypothetical protein
VIAYRMISAEKAEGFPVSVARGLLGVSRSAFRSGSAARRRIASSPTRGCSGASRRSMARIAASMAGGAFGLSGV